MSTAFFTIPRESFLKLCGTITTFLLFTIQCTWTPEVKTPIYSGEEGNVGLQTSSDFKRPPQHPAELSESLIKQILEGISQTQERGILQELYISDAIASPVFSPTQIKFLVPHLAEAFSQATSEELITFRSSGNEEGSQQIRGTLAVFSPTIILLTLQQTGNYQRNLSKTTSSSRNLQSSLSLTYSEKQAIVEPEEAKRFMAIPSKVSWIAINYESTNLRRPTENYQEKDQLVPIQRTPSPPLDLNSLREQVEGLQKTVDEQAEEIQRLQETTPE